MSHPMSVETIERRILVLRGVRVMLDQDLARLYGVTTSALNQAVRRNESRFPPDFIFRLTGEEARSLRSQTVILDRGRGRYRKYRPNAFTEQGVAMLSSVLRSERAVRVNIEIMRTFVRLRMMASSNIGLSQKIDVLERRYDSQFRIVFEAIRRLMAPPKRPKTPIGFRLKEPRSLRYETRDRFRAAAGL